MGLIVKQKTFSKEKREILLYTQEFPQKEGTLIVGGFHGDEPDGCYFIGKYIEDFNNGLCDNVEKNIYFIPCLNPDGISKNTRKNANLVDLNRNFPTKNWAKTEITDDYYGGNSPSSEIETKFIIDVIEKYEPKKIITLHSPYGIVNYDGKQSEDFAKKIGKIIDYPVCSDIGYPTSGSFGTYYGLERNIAVITLEIAENVSRQKFYPKIKLIFDNLC